MKAEESVCVTSTLLSILEDLHAVGVVHRDIKPSNIILRDGDPCSPVLIDLGLGVAEGDDTVTEAREHIGNRFLFLPEQKGMTSDKRDPRSDVTLAVGVLFACLSGEWPICLVDEHGHKPHQRPAALSTLNAIQGPYADRVRGVFARGFEASLANRWQSAAELRAALQEEPVHDQDAGKLTQALPLTIVWTLHCDEGKPTSLYIHASLVAHSCPDDLDHFFVGNQSPMAIDELPPRIQRAIASVAERGLEKVREILSSEGVIRFKKVRDHFSRGWFYHRVTPDHPRIWLRWNRELTMGHSVKTTNPVEFEMGPDPYGGLDLEALDAFAEEIAAHRYLEAMKAMADFESEVDD